MPLDPRKKILLVEDEALIALSEKKALEKYGYDVTTVGTGEAAVESIDGGIDTDLVLMDIDLGGGMDGTQAAARILEKRDLPIVFLSSHTEPEIVERTEKITSYGYVVKYSSITVLDASIKMAFKLFEANRKTLENEQRQNALIANISDVIVVIDRDGINRYKSPNIRKWFGWDPAEVVGRPALDNVHPEDRAYSRGVLDRLASARTGDTATAEVRYLCKDGSYKWIKITLVNMVDDPIVRGILGNYHDISERKQAELANDFERKFTERLLQSLPGIFYLYTYPELRLARWNRDHEVLLGFTAGEMQGRSIFEWHVPGSEEAVRAAVDTAMERGVNQLEAPLIAKDGRQVPFLMTGVPFESEGRKYLMGIGIDLTGYKRIESELRESQARLSALFGAMTEMVVLHELVFDEGGRPADYRIIDCNEAYTRITGIPKEKAVGRLGSEVYGSNPAPYLKEFSNVGISGKPYQYETYYGPMRKHFSISVVSPGKNQFATITTDVTPLKEIESRLQLQVEEYEVLLKEVHHRIKNNLAAIESLISLQGASSRNPEVRTALADTLGRIAGMRILYEKLLGEGSYEESSVQDYVESLVQSMKDALTVPEGISIRSRVDVFSLPPKRLFPLGIIVNELVTNSIKHAFVGRDRGDIEIILSRNGAQAILEVRDDGSGILVPRIQESATGFGLNLVRMLTEQLGGELSIETSRGTRVVVKFQV